MNAIKLGIVCSAGGSAVCSALELLFEAGALAAADVLMVTDRACGAEEKAERLGVASVRLPYHDAASFSAEAVRRFEEAGCDLVVLFYSRRVSESLFERLPTLNVHPSLLPAFPGMGSDRKARDAGARFLGATLHNVTAVFDDGPIVAQVVAPMNAAMTDQQVGRISYIQKTYLLMVLVDHYRTGSLVVDRDTCTCHLEGTVPANATANPTLLSAPLVAAFAAFQSRLQAQVIQT